jgi:ElaB/YqjD/DUF883 family membrane-anchored ribosome-binding protein
MNTNDLTQKSKEWQEQASEAADEIQDKAQRWQARASEGARRAARTANDYVEENPWQIIGAVALVALALGILLGRSRD